MPVKNIFTQSSVPSLFFYDPRAKDAASRAVLTLKHHRYTDLYGFIAAELSCEIQKLLDELEIDAKSCIFTHIPRTEKAIRENGFDQSELLARTLCEHIGGYAALPLLRRTGGKEQKTLSASERKINARSSFYINGSMRGINKRYGNSIRDVMEGRTVILIDDIMTSGASMSQGIRSLRHAGAKTVLCAVIARAEVAPRVQKSAKVV